MFFEEAPPLNGRKIIISASGGLPEMRGCGWLVREEAYFWLDFFVTFWVKPKSKEARREKAINSSLKGNYSHNILDMERLRDEET
ncbi:hypothetical protein [Pleomorphovibrio marinus]|uniref:hypothetical protein n=1 Tax=Pleomorphovibrio marinus TaxID=2164132 RepID=UPI001300BB45|nr:hypothetical protein [Pleomorphovibrio marinus]